jgi:hypothetical protein
MCSPLIRTAAIIKVAPDIIVKVAAVQFIQFIQMSAFLCTIGIVDAVCVNLQRGVAMMGLTCCIDDCQQQDRKKQINTLHFADRDKAH